MYIKIHHMSEGVQVVELPEQLIRQVEDRLEYTEFESAEEYLAFAVEQLLRGVEERSTDDEPLDSDGEIRDQLESLGYL